MNFTASQKSAINHTSGNLQLIACAGSGKTEVVARRVATLLKEGAKPANIVAFTFTDKAAAELKERIITSCREELGELHGMAEMYVGTIHGFCLELLKSEVPKYLKFDVLSEIQQSLFIDRFSSQSGLTTSTDLRGTPLRRFVDTKNYRTALTILREDEPIHAKIAKNSILDGLEKYTDLLDENRYFDYTAIMESAVEALTNESELRDRLGKRIKHVIVDEYQDVNPIQEAIIWSLHELGSKVCVVGDDDQTIYQWRGSNVKGILEFQKRYQPVTQIKLEENFRSSNGIIETAREFIEQNTTRLDKKMQPAAAQDFEEGDILALSFETPEQEAQHIVASIQALHGVAIKNPTKDDPKHQRGIAYSDMAVLFRSVDKNAEPVSSAFEHAGIPYIVVGMNNLFTTLEAEAARQLFYFMAERPTIDAAGLATLWLDAGLGLKKPDVQKAIHQAQSLREEFTATNQRNVRYGFHQVFLKFLETAGVREEKVPNHRGEIAFYNLGKFTQVISDYETINYRTKPVEKFEGFASFLEYQVDDAYPEGAQTNQYANPDAVRIMTVHKAKGMQWPVVFVPALVRNRFPSAKLGGRSVWHLLPKDGFNDQSRYEGSVEDERRLFYVAMTRSQKFLHMTWAPIPGFNNRYTRHSEFWEDVLASKFVKRKPVDYSTRKHLPATPRKGVSNVVFSFSDLKYLFECPYQFKLRILYNFNPPIQEQLGFGRSLHNALAEVHARVINGKQVNEADVASLVDTHLHLPYANPKVKEDLGISAEHIIRNYIEDNKSKFDNIEFSEKQIDISLEDGISVIGRIDLVRRKDTNEVTIVDLKSNDQAQPEVVTEHQLHIYALGYQELTGQRADYVEIYELDNRKGRPRSVDDDFIADVKHKVASAAQALRNNHLPAAPFSKKCTGCDYRGMCSPGAHACA